MRAAVSHLKLHPIPGDSFQMTCMASPLPEVYTTDKVSYVNLHLKEEEIVHRKPRVQRSYGFRERQH